MKYTVISFFITIFLAACISTPAQQIRAIEVFRYDISENTGNDRWLATKIGREFTIDLGFEVSKKALKQMQKVKLPVFQKPATKKIGNTILLIAPPDKSVCEIFDMAAQAAEIAKSFYKRKIEVKLNTAYIEDRQKYTQIISRCGDYKEET